MLDTDQRMDTLVDTRAVVLRHIEDSARVGEDIMAHTRDIRDNVTTLVQNSDTPFRGTVRPYSHLFSLSCSSKVHSSAASPARTSTSRR